MEPELDLDHILTVVTKNARFTVPHRRVSSLVLKKHVNDFILDAFQDDQQAFSVICKKHDITIFASDDANIVMILSHDPEGDSYNPLDIPIRHKVLPKGLAQDQEERRSWWRRFLFRLRGL